MKVSGFTLLIIWAVIMVIGMAESVYAGSVNQYSIIAYALLIGIPSIVYLYKRRQPKTQMCRNGN